MTNDFLPEDYEVPKSDSRYMKFEPGINNFRFLSSPVIGYRYWIEENGKKKPIRVKNLEDIDQTKINEKNPVKHFWAAVVYNYKTKQIEILEITQKKVQEAIRKLTKRDSWGSPKGYDLVVEREGEGLETKYSVNPEPKVVLAAGIRDQYENTKINLEALFTGGNPFEDSNAIPDEELDKIPL